MDNEMLSENWAKNREIVSSQSGHAREGTHEDNWKKSSRVFQDMEILLREDSHAMSRR
jgi:hypothetical protein